jgi:hypothetical protein
MRTWRGATPIEHLVLNGVKCNVGGHVICLYDSCIVTVPAGGVDKTKMRQFQDGRAYPEWYVPTVSQTASSR